MQLEWLPLLLVVASITVVMSHVASVLFVNLSNAGVLVGDTKIAIFWSVEVLLLHT